MSTSKRVTIDCSYLPEPLLRFGDDGLHVDPKAGIARFGPRSFSSIRDHPRHPKIINVGFVGTAATIDTARNWLETCAQGVIGNEKHPEFPGFLEDRGFFSRLEFGDSDKGQVTQSELEQALNARTYRLRFESVLQLFEDKLRLLTDQDHQMPDYIVVAIPDEIRRYKVVEYTNPEKGRVHRDLRRAFKALAMKYRVPTQLLLQPTMEGKDETHPSKIAWNFFTGLYFKAGGTPWSPVGLAPGTCYIGIAFYRPLGSAFPHMQTSLAQAFDEHGEGLVLRGHDFEWNEEKERSRSPHLSEQQAHDLINLVLRRYQDEMKQFPQRVVVHKTSRYWEAESAGFRAALRGRVAKYDLLALETQSTVRLITTSKYPPLRGTRFSVGDLDFLYTTGYISALNEFHAMHVPSPLRIADHVGQDTSRETLLKEILTLTKMNCNSAHLGGLLPITVKFSELVGSILREVPSDREPRPQFKFYM